MRTITLLVTFDDTCQDLATLLANQVAADLRGATGNDGSIDVSAKLMSASSGSGAHREAIFTALQQLFHVKHDDVQIVTLLRNANPDEYRRVREMCASTKPQIANVQVLTNLENFSDAGLLIRNMSRKVVATAISRQR